MTQERIKELFEYRLGLLVRRESGKNRTVGMPVGSWNPDGYFYVWVDGKSHGVHRLVWLWHYGYVPKEIDHIDGDKLNNKIENLREVTRSENMRNTKRPKNNTSGYVGVYPSRKKWLARISNNGKIEHLGSFDTIEEALSMRLCAESEYGYHKNHGRTLDN